MSLVSDFIKMTLQELNENPDSWGSVLNVSALELLEDAIAGTGNAEVTSGNVALDDTAGGPSDAASPPSQRWMIINITGSPGAPREVTTPPRSKIYLVVNNTTGGQTITFKTTSGAGVEIPAASAVWVYCDTTDILASTVETAINATLAATATNALSLGGILAADYGPLDVPNIWTKAQATEQKGDLLVAGGGPYTLDIDADLSNSFYHLTTQTFTLTAPTNGDPGNRFSLIIEQGGGGGHTINYVSNTFQFAGGVGPTLSTVVGEIDYFAFELTTTSVGDRWIGGLIKDVSDV